MHTKIHTDTYNAGPYVFRASVLLHICATCEDMIFPESAHIVKGLLLYAALRTHGKCLQVRRDASRYLRQSLPERSHWRTLEESLEWRLGHHINLLQP